jgi:hypothetical protein
MAVITSINRVLNVVSVLSDVVTDNKSMVCGTAKAGHAQAVHLMSHQQMPGYQQRPWGAGSRERTTSRASWRCWRLAEQRVALSSPAPLAKPWKQGAPPAGLAASRKPDLMSKRLTDEPDTDARGFTGRMAIPAPLA